VLTFSTSVHYTVYQDHATLKRRTRMTETVSIGRVKRDISELVNRVAYGGERIILTSRGKPKAALVSITDYERLQEQRSLEGLAQWHAWRPAVEKLGAAILERRGGKTLDVNALWESAREDLEARDDRLLGR
jgi:prevent-host-death family protein